MFEAMKKLIGIKFYVSGEEAQDIVNVFLATKQLTTDQYIELTTLVNEKYGSAAA